MSSAAGEAWVIAVLVLAICAAIWLKARQTIRREAARPRGIAPGHGDHIIDVEYSSGLGGGHATQIRVPRDPQAYARRFVPLGASPAGNGPRGHAGKSGSPTRRRERENDE